MELRRAGQVGGDTLTAVRSEERVRTTLEVPGPLEHSWQLASRLVRFAADLTAALIAGLVVYVTQPHIELHRIYLLGLRVHYIVLAVASMPVWLGCLAAAGAYRRRRPYEGLVSFRVPIVTALQLMAAVAIGSFVFNLPVSRDLVVIYFPSLIAAVVVTRWMARVTLARALHQGHGTIRVVLVGDPRSVRQFATHLLRKDSGAFEVAGVCTPMHGHDTLEVRGRRLQCVGRPDEVVSKAKELNADTVAVVGPSPFTVVTLQEIAWQLERSGIDLLVAPDVVEMAGPRIRVTPIMGLPLLHITEPRIGGSSRKLKSLYERSLAIPLLILLSPIFVVAAIAILWDSGLPVFYRQERLGLGSKPFRMLKFRTMVPDADERLEGLRLANEHDGPLFKIREDPRVTRPGRWLRRYSIDELPQLINVVKGDMDLVGPRPCLGSERESFGETARRRFLAKPGMTGLWQVSGRTDIPWEDAMLLDLYYVENWSPVMDLVIAFRTLRVVLAGRGC